MKPKAFILDVDGTIAIKGDRGTFDFDRSDVTDKPNLPVIAVARALVMDRYDVVVCSGREDKFREPTRRFINEHMPWLGGDYPLFMRKTGDFRSDQIIKEEIYRKHIEPYYDILLSLDDRQRVVDMWRSIGLTCLQCAPGNF